MDLSPAKVKISILEINKGETISSYRWTAQILVEFGLKMCNSVEAEWFSNIACRLGPDLQSPTDMLCMWCSSRATAGPDHTSLCHWCSSSCDPKSASHFPPQLSFAKTIFYSAENCGTCGQMNFPSKHMVETRNPLWFGENIFSYHWHSCNRSIKRHPEILKLERTMFNYHLTCATKF